MKRTMPPGVPTLLAYPRPGHLRGLPPGYDVAARHMQIRYRRHQLQAQQPAQEAEWWYQETPETEPLAPLPIEQRSPIPASSGTRSILVVMVLLIMLMLLGVAWSANRVTSQIATVTHTSAIRYSVTGSPTVNADFINQVLNHYHSPAAGIGQVMVDDGVKYGIDPVYALAFFLHESSFGTQGEARATFAIGNERCISDRPCIDVDRGGYARFYSWSDGVDHWYALIAGPLYVGSGLTTIDQIIPRYAPGSDHNDESAYIQAITSAVAIWRSGHIEA